MQQPLWTPIDRPDVAPPALGTRPTTLTQPRMINFSPSPRTAVNILYTYPLRANQDLVWANGRVRIKQVSFISHPTSRLGVAQFLRRHVEYTVAKLVEIASDMETRTIATPADVYNLWEKVTGFREIQACMRTLWAIITSAQLLRGDCLPGHTRGPVLDVVPIVEASTHMPFRLDAVDPAIYEVDMLLHVDKQSWLHAFAHDPDTPRQITRETWRPEADRVKTRKAKAQAKEKVGGDGRRYKRLDDCLD